MDHQVTWFRRRIIATVAARLTVAGLVGALALTGAAVATGRTAPAPVAVAAVAAGLITSALWLATSLRTNPIDRRYLRAYLDESVSVEAPEQSPLPPLTEPGGGPRHCFTIDDAAAGRVVQSVFVSGPVVITRSRVTDAVVFYSGLLDGRFVCTDDQLTVPRPGWVMNVVRDDAEHIRLRSHHDLLRRLAADGIPADPAPDPRVVLRHLEAEREGFRRLGSFWGCFVGVHGGSRFRLLADIDPGDLLALEGIRPAASTPTFERVLRVVPTPPPAPHRAVTRAPTP